jgi:hypothetical protein
MVFEKFKELVSNLHLQNLEKFQIVRIETGVSLLLKRNNRPHTGASCGVVGFFNNLI